MKARHIITQGLDSQDLWWVRSPSMKEHPRHIFTIPPEAAEAAEFMPSEIITLFNIEMGSATYIRLVLGPYRRLMRP